MIAYFDTSAIIPLLVNEPGTAMAGQLWDRAGRVVSIRLSRVEARAALAQAARLGRISSGQLRAAKRQLDFVLDQLDLVEIDEELARRAGDLAETHALRGYDAVHLAAAERIRDDDMVLVAGDRALLSAATRLSMATATVV